MKQPAGYPSAAGPFGVGERAGARVGCLVPDAKLSRPPTTLVSLHCWLFLAAWLPASLPTLFVCLRSRAYGLSNG